MFSDTGPPLASAHHKKGDTSGTTWSICCCYINSSGSGLFGAHVGSSGFQRVVVVVTGVMGPVVTLYWEGLSLVPVQRGHVYKAAALGKFFQNFVLNLVQMKKCKFGPKATG